VLHDAGPEEQAFRRGAKLTQREVHFKLQRDWVFVVGAPDEYTREWLENQLSSTVTRFLTGVCNRPLIVRFVEIKEMSAKEKDPREPTPIN
jgi:chromosomal replication initiation ATPase DnaA